MNSVTDMSMAIGYRLISAANNEDEFYHNKYPGFIDLVDKNMEKYYTGKWEEKSNGKEV